MNDFLDAAQYPNSRFTFDNWQPIDNAKPGRYLLYFPAGTNRAQFMQVAMMKVDNHPVGYPRKPTHYMKLPAPPVLP